MNYLLDTCVISELVKQKPNKNVIKWISNINEDSLFLSVFTFAELHKGVEKLTVSKKKKELQNWININLMQRFEGKIIDFDITVATIWGAKIAEAEKNGVIPPLMDSLIAISALAYNLTMVTRNIKDMQNCGVTLLNPWNKN